MKDDDQSLLWTQNPNPWYNLRGEAVLISALQYSALTLQRVRSLLKVTQPVTPTLWEAEKGGLKVQAQPGHFNDLARPRLSSAFFTEGMLGPSPPPVLEDADSPHHHPAAPGQLVL